MMPVIFVLLLKSETRCGFTIQVQIQAGGKPWTIGVFIILGVFCALC